MLKYFKKRKGSRHGGTWTDGPFRNSDAQIEENDEEDKNESSHQNEFDLKRNSLKSTSSFCDDILSQGELIEEDGVDGAASCGGSLGGYSLILDDDAFRYKSRLAMSLPSIVSDPNCLSYFVQYFDTKNALAPLKFYLDIENFKTAALAHLEKNQTAEQLPLECSSIEQTSTTEYENETNTSGRGDTTVTYEDDETNILVPELRNFYDISMRQPLTDDEKSQIYAETNKQINKCNEGSTRSINTSKSGGGSIEEATINTTTSQASDKKSTESDIESCRKGGDGNKFVSAASVKDAISIYQKYLIANANQFVALPVAILSQISLLLCRRAEIEATAAAAACTATSPTDGKKDEAEELKEALEVVDVVRTIPATCFDEAQQYVMDQLERIYLNDFLQSAFYSKYCLELVEQGQPALNIYDILYSEATLFFFMEFLEQHGERECLDFWTAAINFRKSYAATSEEPVEFKTTDDSTSALVDKAQRRTSAAQNEAQADAMIIYEKFFSLQAENRFCLSDRLRSRVEERICVAESRRIAYCFDLPLQLIAKYLDCKYFQDFLKSQIFQNYLKELKLKLREACDGDSDELTPSTDNTTNTSTKPNAAVAAAAAALTRGVFRKSQHRKSLSDCSELNAKREAFKHNTLLAMDGSKLPQQARLKTLPHAVGTSDMHIDARQLTNPNLLWHRAHSTDGACAAGGGGGLKFGHITELGRYERDFEPMDALGNDTTFGGGGIGGAFGVKHNWSLNYHGNKLKNAMRKLVNLPEEKVQEEIAWQVAEMIIKDVTSVTLKKN